MRNPKLVPYETIVRATSGEPEAIDEVLRHYGKRIRLASLENGQVNKDTEDNIKQRLVAALFSRVDRHLTMPAPHRSVRAAFPHTALHNNIYSFRIS